MLELYHHIQDANVTLQGDLAFTNDWDFFMADPAQRFENLVATGPNAGTLEAFATGTKLRTRYEHILQQALAQNQTSFWASGSKRVIETAKYFGAGFFGIDWQDVASLHVIPETPERGGDTLTPGKTCRNFAANVDAYGHDYGIRMLYEWRHTYLPPIIERLAKHNPDTLFSEAEVYSMQELCGFETIAKGSSQWCDVFTHDEWKSFEYARDLLHYYRAGPGNPYSRAMGWLWLNATAGLLRQGPEEAGSMFFSLWVYSSYIRQACDMSTKYLPASTTATSYRCSLPWSSSRNIPTCQLLTSYTTAAGAPRTSCPWAVASFSSALLVLRRNNAGITKSTGTRITFTARLLKTTTFCASTSMMDLWRFLGVRVGLAAPARLRVSWKESEERV